MKWNDIFFNTNFKDSIQDGIHEFARQSGYQIKETKQVEKIKPHKRNNVLRLLLLCLVIAFLISAIL